ncbi:3-dehydroquinate synthase II [Evansella sp. AB-P1]|uniref:3-dehydroquinate synthase II n=1 Tax=Evansella sp. AB-P1 TaxID=3037653 RepID=UPI00241DBAE4|nr:3-dehydroquinate synthase II [Evansella sp. AB-P1]MDG5787065.1 3-dehydroquinate synthase II [Evansella sp. AB-P1]
MESQTLNKTAYIEVIDIIDVGEGMRVCIDFMDVLNNDDGLYIGNTGHGYIKVLSENRKSEHYPPRPFRINCGAFHQYLYQNGQTLYLHEVNPGNKISLINAEGEKELSVGRVKIEKRPFLRVVCKSKNEIISVTLQNASSVYVEEENKGEVSVLDLKKGDKIKCIQDSPGRHLGDKIDEIIIEK